ncbi:hypothetical protein [Winogradskyella sp. SYSU M77433]|uniref:hypothetical protein n=1 Tax=Winogradskyella sp. SYSU M77433 TaxID=3042722 RepID=UPI0024816A4F|nr:hypothetical protein [Winogradskyella sp. SYSU M77433]MDH7912079.1 hypothetical protein [Winogradskyella sp. SYSU M77433]
MSEEEKKSQHREFTQRVITRMNTNSFQIKGMMITIIAAFLAVYAANPKSIFIILPVPLVILFWFLDSYYLQMERKFRGIYKDICDLNKENEEKLTLKIFEMNPKLYKGGDYCFWKVLLWSSITVLYLITTISLIIMYLILEYC